MYTVSDVGILSHESHAHVHAVLNPVLQWQTQHYVSKGRERESATSLYSVTRAGEVSLPKDPSPIKFL